LHLIKGQEAKLSLG